MSKEEALADLDEAEALSGESLAEQGSKASSRKDQNGGWAPGAGQQGGERRQGAEGHSSPSVQGRCRPDAHQKKGNQAL